MKRSLISLFLILFLACISVPSYALFNSDIKKAKEFIKAGMYPQAIELLNKRINEKPTDAEAHFTLGTCYLQQRDLSMADQRFESAVKLEPKNGPIVATEFQKAGNTSLDQGNVSLAQNLYLKAIQFNPVLRDQIAQGCFNRAAASMNTSLLDLAAGLDPSYKMKAYNLIIGKLDTVTDPKTKIQIYRTALAFNHEAKQTVIDAVAEIAKKQDKKLVEPEIKQFQNDVLEQIIEKAWPPDYVVYHPGQIKVFVLKAGQESDHFVRPEYGAHISFQSQSGQYEVITRAGKVYQKGSTPKHLLEDFKIRAVTDTDMRLVFE